VLVISAQAATAAPRILLDSTAIFFPLKPALRDLYIYAAGGYIYAAGGLLPVIEAAWTSVALPAIHGWDRCDKPNCVRVPP
jgi:hypothetical protein